MDSSVYDHENDMKAVMGAIKSNLPCEVIWSAMNYLKQNPKKTIEDAIEYGYAEWDL